MTVRAYRAKIVNWIDLVLRSDLREWPQMVNVDEPFSFFAILQTVTDHGSV